MESIRTGGQARLPFPLFKASWLHLITMAVVFFFFAVPIVRLILLSVQGESGFELAQYEQILTSARTWSVMKNTVYIVCGSTAMAIALGLLMAWIVAYCDIRLKGFLQALILLPFIIPSYIVTLAWAQFFAPKSAFSAALQTIAGAAPWNVYSLGGIIFVMGLSHYPIVYMLSLGVFRKIPRDLEMASRLSGASRWSTFRKVTWPMALPGIASGGLLAFLAGLDNFGIPAFLGIPANISVLSTYIYEEIVGFGPSAFARAAVLSVLLGAVACAGTLVQWFVTRKAKTFETSAEDKEPRVRLGRLRLPLELLLWGFLLATSVIPLFSMFATSVMRAYGLEFIPANWTLDHYAFLLLESGKAKQAMANSGMLALVTTLICLVAGTAVAYLRLRKPSRWMKAAELMISIPYALPGIVLALAMILVWMEPIPGWNPGIYGSTAILYIAYAVRFLILQMRGSATALQQVDVSMEEAAHSNGAGRVQKWRRILLPLLFPGLLSGAFLVLLYALTELTVSSILWSSGSETIGVVIFGFEQAGDTTYSTAFSSLIVLLIGIGMLALFIVQQVWKRRMKSI